ncbi:MAG: glycoside hydrolase family 88 protein [Verrucomicrobiae bacterium]|nr:glycoside hydrolase family 88 protein [Verrucomicrobiae bacterium]
MNTSPAVNGRSPIAGATAAANRQLSDVLNIGLRKTRRNIRRLADDPKAAPWALDGDYFVHKETFYEIGNWTSSFFTGMALIAWRQTEDEYFLEQVLRLAPYYREKVFTHHLDTHHDLGFLYSLYSVALYKLTGDQQHRDIGLRAAEILSQRFNEKGNFIRAWGRMDETVSRVGNGTAQTDNMCIVDCMMNLPLLYWASHESGDQKYRNIAVRHANMVMKYFIRPDNSVWHAYRFNPQTGAPIGPENFCGRGVDSYWARGASWAIYGFALSYTYTRDDKYLAAAMRLAKKFVQQLDAEVVPVWDFRLPADAEPVRDASAAMIAVCGIQELAKHHAADNELLQAKRALLDRVCTQDYIEGSDGCPGVLKRAYGDQPAYSSWGDYYLMEALSRELKGEDTFW